MLQFDLKGNAYQANPTSMNEIRDDFKIACSQLAVMMGEHVQNMNQLEEKNSRLTKEVENLKRSLQQEKEQSLMLRSNFMDLVKKMQQKAALLSSPTMLM